MNRWTGQNDDDDETAEVKKKYGRSALSQCAIAVPLQQEQQSHSLSRSVKVVIDRG